jgi:hypothetical protein
MYHYIIFATTEVGLDIWAAGPITTDDVGRLVYRKALVGLDRMGESKIPLFAYVDESGNTGKNIFDEAQPDFYLAALVYRGDFDAVWGSRLKAAAQKVGTESLHGNELGLGRLEQIAEELHSIIEGSRTHFFLSRVEKRYLLATKMFDVLFDSGENAAVAWHNYNLRPLKIMLAFKLSAIIDDSIAREFWSCLLLPRDDDARRRLPAICEALKARLHIAPDERSRQIFGDGLDWIVRHPECIQFANEQKAARQGHFANLVAFANMLRGLQYISKLLKKRVERKR